MHGIPGNVMGALIVFYVSDILHAPRWISIVILGYYFFAFVFLPIIAMLIGAGLMFRFPLTRERQQELRRQVDVRDAHRR